LVGKRVNETVLAHEVEAYVIGKCRGMVQNEVMRARMVTMWESWHEEMLRKRKRDVFCD